MYCNDCCLHGTEHSTSEYSKCRPRAVRTSPKHCKRLLGRGNDNRGLEFYHASCMARAPCIQGLQQHEHGSSLPHTRLLLAAQTVSPRPRTQLPYCWPWNRFRGVIKLKQLVGVCYMCIVYIKLDLPVSGSASSSNPKCSVRLPPQRDAHPISTITPF